MTFNCQKCMDTGSLNAACDSGGEYYDCTDCNVADQRAALDKFADKQTSDGRELHWAIHQRALAMAPKQEAPKPVAQDCGACLGSGWVPRDADIGTEQECFSCDGTGKSEDAAPAAANGALTDKREMFDRMYLSMHSFHTKAELDKEWHRTGAMFCAALAAGPDAALADLLSEVSDVLASQNWRGDLQERLRDVAALSGAKGN